jgi:hypothetical protein
MVQSFKNENMISGNMCEVFMNDVMQETYEINLSFQIEIIQNPKKEKKIRKLHAQITLWKSHGRNILCWTFFVSMIMRMLM